MKKIMLIGPIACGKSTLCQVLNNLCMRYKKTQAIEIVQNVIDTPGEYLENRNFYRALIVTATQADVILLVQDCSDDRALYPPTFTDMFSGKPVVGIVSKIDLAKNEKQLIHAEQKLKNAGVRKLFRVSCLRQDSLEQLKNYLVS